MFGIRGLTGLGLIHVAFGVSALALGLTMLLQPKGTPRHRRIGQGYVLAMLFLNLTALSIYHLFGRFGPFHVASLISLATICAGFVPVFIRRPRIGWMDLHAHFMCWSYGGLVAAFLAEVGVRTPGLHFGVAVIVASVVTIAVGAVVIFRQVPKTLARFAKRALTPNGAVAPRRS
jgi:uncharacterized membrane protein